MMCTCLVVCYISRLCLEGTDWLLGMNDDKDSDSDNDYDDDNDARRL